MLGTLRSYSFVRSADTIGQVRDLAPGLSVASALYAGGA